MFLSDKIWNLRKKLSCLHEKDWNYESCWDSSELTWSKRCVWANTAFIYAVNDSNCWMCFWMTKYETYEKKLSCYTKNDWNYESHWDSSKLTWSKRRVWEWIPVFIEAVNERNATDIEPQTPLHIEKSFLIKSNRNHSVFTNWFLNIAQLNHNKSKS